MNKDTRSTIEFCENWLKEGLLAYLPVLLYFILTRVVYL